MIQFVRRHRPAQHILGRSRRAVAAQQHRDQRRFHARGCGQKIGICGRSDYGIEAFLAGVARRIGGAGGDDDAVAERLEQICDLRRDIGRRRENEQRQAMRRDLLYFVGGIAALAESGLAGDGQGEPELRAFARHAFKADLPAGLINDPLGHGQTQSGALLVTRIGCIARRERLEQKMRHVRRHAQPGVVDGEAHKGVAFFVVLGVKADVHQSAGGEFQGIVGDLEQHLAHPARIGGDAGQFRRGSQCQAQALFPGARLQQARHGAGGLQRIAILVFQLLGIVAGQCDDVVQQGEKALAGFQHDLDMIGLALGQFGAFQQLRHAQQRVHRRAQFVADIGDERRLGHGAGLGPVARGDCFGLFARQPFHQPGILAAQEDAFVNQPPHALAIRNQHGAEKAHQDGRHGGVKPTLQQQQPDQRPQRQHRVRGKGGAMRRAGDEFGGGHAQIGQRQIGLGGEGIPGEPEKCAQAPGGAGDGRNERVAPRPEMRIVAMDAVALAACFVGGGELLGGDHHSHLQQQRRHRQQAQRVAGQQGGGYAQHRERQ